MGTKVYFIYCSLFIIGVSFLFFAVLQGLFQGKSFNITPEAGSGYLASLIMLIPSYLMLILVFTGCTLFIYSIFFIRDLPISAANPFSDIRSGFTKFQLIISLIIIPFLLIFNLI
jgi:hypothetical protein